MTLSFSCFCLIFIEWLKGDKMLIYEHNHTEQGQEKEKKVFYIHRMMTLFIWCDPKLGQDL